MATEAKAHDRQRLSDRARLWILGVGAIALFVAYLFVANHGNWDYVLPRRATRVLAMVLSGAAIGTSTLIFQTLTNNRILTPSVIGLDALYILIQTATIFVFGSSHLVIRHPQINFTLTVVLMLVFSILMYRMFFAKERGSIYFMLLIGIVFGTFFQSITSVLQVLIDPNEFLVAQDRMFASINNVKTQLLPIATVGMVATMLYLSRYIKYLDALALGKAHAINLGLDYPMLVRRLLMIVFIFVSISTALVGPITFLGLIVVNIAYEFLKTFRRRQLIVASSLLAWIALALGQMIVEHVFTFSTTLSVIINFIGGIYFLHLILKERAI